MHKTIILAGKNSNLGASLTKLSPAWELIERNKFDFLSPNLKVLEKLKPDNIIISAAYTNVDQAEIERDEALKINAGTVKEIAKFAKINGTRIIYLSTDYVFNGDNTIAYTEDDNKNPINHYGYTKAKGEDHIIELLDNFYIIRTSWLYSEFGTNFVKTMLRLMQQTQELKIINDQVGCPTYAFNLANMIIQIITKKIPSGIYHYRDQLSLSWFEFSKLIHNNLSHHLPITANLSLLPIASHEYKTFATRPKFSVLNIDKITSLDIPSIETSTSLSQCISNLMSTT
ncbi:dTDP-4-dehydrorhamnose reductase [Rickettsiales endosymbiont of Stachyamoeba lipophora]|uniref:dTDP-4-dehydrorhamnose reductase n=1 Tax=Rickettsiales endosymbiont of Stachyamoeba lipophora TaxID=2486578 RepID=UPI000F646FEC|nr:dTDP-4-dehydrorhamnose reductase [Rickettsiales endosymbiont of Stachyamoeba lipophora]AZL15850.1 dTDP-4-dehydrorhamnose reductase [Rickettsiales endosymbiont of Stachyamoeba lipophora]